MIEIVNGPLIVAPEFWTLAFSRDASTRLGSWLAMGKYKHVRAYAYVPFLHVWVFYDPHLRATELFLAADGEPAQEVIQLWMVEADLIRIRVRACRRRLPLFGWCVPAIKRLIGLRCLAVRPDALYRHCLQNGGIPFEAVDGSAAVQSAAA